MDEPYGHGRVWSLAPILLPVIQNAAFELQDGDTRGIQVRLNHFPMLLQVLPVYDQRVPLPIA